MKQVIASLMGLKSAPESSGKSAQKTSDHSRGFEQLLSGLFTENAKTLRRADEKNPELHSLAVLGSQAPESSFLKSLSIDFNGQSSLKKAMNAEERTFINTVTAALSSAKKQAHGKSDGKNPLDSANRVDSIKASSAQEKKGKTVQPETQDGSHVEKTEFASSDTEAVIDAPLASERVQSGEAAVASNPGDADSAKVSSNQNHGSKGDGNTGPPAHSSVQKDAGVEVDSRPTNAEPDFRGPHPNRPVSQGAEVVIEEGQPAVRTDSEKAQIHETPARMASPKNASLAEKVSLDPGGTESPDKDAPQPAVSSSAGQETSSPTDRGRTLTPKLETADVTGSEAPKAVQNDSAASEAVAEPDSVKKATAQLSPTPHEKAEPVAVRAEASIQEPVNVKSETDPVSAPVNQKEIRQRSAGQKIHSQVLDGKDRPQPSMEKAPDSRDTGTTYVEENPAASAKPVSVRAESDKPAAKTHPSAASVQQPQDASQHSGSETGDGQNQSSSDFGRTFQESMTKPGEKGTSQEAELNPRIDPAVNRVGATQEAKASAPASETMPALNERVLQQVTPVLTRMFRQGDHRMTLTLRPKDLGTLKIELDTGKGVLEGRFLVDTQEVKEALEATLPELRTALQKEGIATGQLNVDLSGSFQQSSQAGKELTQQRRSGGKRETSKTDKVKPEDGSPRPQSARNFGYNTMELIA